MSQDSANDTGNKLQSPISSIAPNSSSLNLSPAKQALLDRRLRERQRANIQAIPLRAQVNDVPLSFAQERLWLLDQFLPDATIFQVPRLLRIHGMLDLAALQRALDSLIERHEILRTIYPSRGGIPVQHILPPQPVELVTHDLLTLPESERQASAEKIIDSAMRCRFVLDSDLLLRVTYVQISPQDALLLLCSHHIASDGWSKAILFRELAAFYEDKAVTLKPLPIQYADFALWQRDILQPKKSENLLSFWKTRLAEAPEFLEFPTDFPRTQSKSYRGSAIYATLPESLTADLRKLCQKEGSTLFMTLLAAFKVLLYRYAQQADLVVGCGVSGRSRVEIEGLIGNFVNMLAIRTEIEGQPTFRDWLVKVRGRVLEALEHAELPFEKLVAELQPTRTMSYSPIFQVMFFQENQEEAIPPMAGVAMEEVEVQLGTAKHDLILVVKDCSAYLGLEIEYSTDLFVPDTIERLARQYQRLLEGIVQEPTQQIDLLPLLTDDERHQLLFEWNRTERSFPSNACIHHLFEQQVARQPDSIALAAEDGQLTYAELNARANQLAHYLLKQGAGPDKRIGICVERGLEMLVGLLGIIKAGAAYVPFDPALPPERLAFMAEDAQVAGLVTQHALRGRVGQTTVPEIFLDRDWSVIEQESRANPAIPITDEHLAYMIYTSGSTGRPKGVQLPHRAVVNFLRHMHKRDKEGEAGKADLQGLNSLDYDLHAIPPHSFSLGMSQGDIHLGVANMSFDASVLDFFVPLTIGARLVVLRRETLRDPLDLVEKIKAFGVTVMHATPSTYRLLLDIGWKGDSRLKLYAGGEALPREMAEQLLQRCGSLWNLYGPTETAVYSCIHRVVPDDKTVYVGRPIANTQVYILDDRFQPVPRGAIAELCIGGHGVSRGYWNRPELTAEKYLPDLFSTTPSARIYRTGDLARYREDGLIECMGRIDQQVKIRGFRIELGEVEATLRQIPTIREAIVLLREDRIGDKRLVAYLLLDDSANLDLSAVRQFLQVHLPEYMVPSAFVFLDKVPLSPNGKVDRKALPAPDLPSDDIYVAPATPVEEALARIWTEALNVPRVGLHSHFFNLGGHSLLAAQIIARIRDEFQVDLPMRTVFEKPILADLASAIENALLNAQDPHEMERLLEEFENPHD
jgi:non-ribosomal peptide synthetase component F